MKIILFSFPILVLSEVLCSGIAVVSAKSADKVSEFENYSLSVTAKTEDEAKQALQNKFLANRAIFLTNCKEIKESTVNCVSARFQEFMKNNSISLKTKEELKALVIKECEEAKSECMVELKEIFCSSVQTQLTPTTAQEGNSKEAKK